MRLIMTSFVFLLLAGAQSGCDLFEEEQALTGVKWKWTRVETVDGQTIREVRADRGDWVEFFNNGRFFVQYDGNFHTGGSYVIFADHYRVTGAGGCLEIGEYCGYYAYGPVKAQLKNGVLKIYFNPVWASEERVLIHKPEKD